MIDVPSFQLPWNISQPGKFDDFRIVHKFPKLLKMSAVISFEQNYARAITCIRVCVGAKGAASIGSSLVVVKEDQGRRQF